MTTADLVHVECDEHELWEWPITGPTVDVSCVHCGRSWEIPWTLWFAPVEEQR